MTTFDTLRIGGSSLFVHRKWMDAVSDNIANINTVNPAGEDAFQERMVVAQAVDYGSGEGGVRVARAEYGSAEGRLVHEPDHPLADANGYVRYPNVRITDEMVDLMDARRVFEANATVFQSAKQMLRRAIDI